MGLVIPSTWTGLLGLLPILIGLNNLLNLNKDESDDDKTVDLKRNAKLRGFDSRKRSLWEVIRDPQTYRVSSVTIANGGNNLGIYVPLFATSSIQNLSVIVPVCYVIVGCWLFMSYNLTRLPGIALILSRYARKIFPFVLMWLGYRIIIDSESYRLFLPTL